MCAVRRSIDKLLSELSLEGSPTDSADDVGHTAAGPMAKGPCDSKIDYLTSYNRKTVTKTHREGVRMNATALRRETHIKNRMQKLNTHVK